MSSNYCVICLAPNIPGIEIFSEHGKLLKIAEILSHHFWFQITQSDDISHFVCFECWSKTQTFHLFYQSIENTHREYFSRELVPNDNKIPTENEKSTLSTNNDHIKSDDEHFVACEMLPFTNDNVKENICTALESMRNAHEMKREPTPDILVGSDDENLHDDNDDDDEDEDDDDDSSSDSSDEPSTKEIELVIPTYFDTSCDQCHAIFQTLAEARTHYIDVHSYFNGYIKCCGKRFKTRGHITDHIQWHQNPNSFMCAECNKSFNAKRRLAAHMLRHEPEESKKFLCNKCEKRFSKKFLLNKHISLVHSSVNEEIICHLCSKKFKLQVTLKHHIASVHERAYSQICEICAKTFKTKQGFREHLSTHNDTDETRVQCSYCNALLKNRVSLKTHIRRTHKSTPKKCPYCEKIKPNQQSLTSHILVVHTKPSHQCTICDKSFTKALSLTEHIASHTGENLYTCRYCPKMFKSNSNMYKHKKQSHPEQWSVDRKRKP